MSSLLYSCCSCSRRTAIITGIFVLLLWGLAIKRYVYDGDTFLAEETQLSHALYKIVNYGTSLHSLERKIRKLLQEDPYAGLVQTKVMPAHEKMQSIKKQTKIYEDMKRIPGGPQNFMSTALTTVEETRRKVVTFEEEYYRITNEVSRVVAGLDRETQDAWYEASLFLTEHDLRVTLLKGIFLDQPKKSKRKSASKSNAGTEKENVMDVDEFLKHEKRSFEEMLASLSSMAELASQFEKVKSEFEDLIIKYNITEPDDIFDTPAYPLAKELSKLDKELETRIRDENYQAFIPYVRKYLKKLDVNLQDVQAHLSKKRLRYESLVEMLETDQSNLKDRIKRLRYSKNDEF